MNSYQRGHATCRWLRIRGSVFIRAVSTPVVARALNPQDESSSTSTNVWLLTSPQPENRKVATRRTQDGVRELSLPEHRRSICYSTSFLRIRCDRVAPHMSEDPRLAEVCQPCGLEERQSSTVSPAPRGCQPARRRSMSVSSSVNTSRRMRGPQDCSRRAKSSAALPILSESSTELC